MVWQMFDFLQDSLIDGEGEAKLVIRRRRRGFGKIEQGIRVGDNTQVCGRSSAGRFAAHINFWARVPLSNTYGNTPGRKANEYAINARIAARSQARVWQRRSAVQFH